MKLFIQISVFLTVAQACLAADVREVPKDVSGRVAKLVKNLSKPEKLKEYRLAIFKSKSKGDKKDLKLEKEQIEIAKKVIPELRKLLTIDTSVFSYPGLLAHGSISFVAISGGGFTDEPAEYGYSLLLGIPGGGESVHTYEFRLLFDDKGVIREIQDIRYKR